ncbi:hypothetical protein KJ611_03365 [Patescibacteria group bacterium]|nr:hypothetical protein [Patescibacteria group bacterium]MBU1705471.1 hypothetical protein [Patescibacteria group bacterium]
MFSEGGSYPEEAKIKWEQRRAEEQHQKELQQIKDKFAAEDVRGQFKQYADEAMAKLFEIPAIAQRFDQDPAFRQEIEDLKAALVSAKDFDQANKIVESFSPEAGAAMKDFLPVVEGTVIHEPIDLEYSKDASPSLES